MRVVFADTVALLAIWDERDQWHQRASVAYAELLGANVRILTTTYVLLECGNAAARRPYRDALIQLRQRLQLNGLLIRPSEGDCDAAWTAFESRIAPSAGIVDYISFEVMRRLGIQEAFTNDRHFTAAGFQVLF
jgi:uncharacterized protein